MCDRRTHSFTKTTFLYLTAILQYALADNISKCCPSGSVLTHRHNDTNNPYECTKMSEYLTEFIGINFDTISKETINKIPICDVHESLDIEIIDNGSNMPSNGCIDYLNNTLYGVGCVNSMRKSKVYLVNKCCQNYFSYHSVELKCVPSSISLDLLSGLFGNSTVLLKELSVPYCSIDEVFVEYHINTTYEYTSIGSNGLQIETTAGRGETEYFPTNSYCIEAIDNYDDIYNFTVIIVRGCKPKSICGQIPCVSKCCKIGHIMREEDAACIESDRHFKPIFHNLSFPLNDEHNRQLSIEPFGKLNI